MKQTQVNSKMEHAQREEKIKLYIEAYNQFDIDKMVADMDNTIVFENIQNGTSNMLLNGLPAFIHQAEETKKYFSARKQTILSFTHCDAQTEIALKYEAVLALDLPNGLKKGQVLNLEGISRFEFSNNKIIKLTDIS